MSKKDSTDGVNTMEILRIKVFEKLELPMEQYFYEQILRLIEGCIPDVEQDLIKIWGSSDNDIVFIGLLTKEIYKYVKEIKNLKAEHYSIGKNALEKLGYTYSEYIKWKSSITDGICSI